MQYATNLNYLDLKLFKNMDVWQDYRLEKKL